MRKWQRAVLFGALAVGVVWFFTSGFVVLRYWVLADASYDKEFRPYIRADVKTIDASYGVPFVFYYLTDRTPFSIRLTYITHNVVENPSVAFDRLAIEFPDGTETDLTGRFRAGVVPRVDEHWYIDDAHEQQKRPCLRFEVTAEDCLHQRIPFTLRVKGQLRSRGAVVEAFDAALTFTPCYETRVLTRWHWVALSGG